MEPTSDEIRLFNEAMDLAESLWEKSCLLRWSKLEPKILSALIYKRLFSHFRGYAILWENKLHTEANIVLRSALEAAICLAANFKMKEDFVNLMKGDAAHSIKGQIQVAEAEGDSKAVKLGWEFYRGILQDLPEGTKSSKLDWKTLADIAEVPILYTFHRRFSGFSAHITGLSILRGITSGTLEPGHAKLDKADRRAHFVMMATAMVQGSFYHSLMINDEESLDRATDLSMRMLSATLDLDA